METLSTVKQVEDYFKKIEVTYTKKTVSKITAIFNFVNKFTVGHIIVEESSVYCSLERTTEDFEIEYYGSDWNKEERNLGKEIDDFINRSKEIDTALSMIIEQQGLIEKICNQYDLDVRDYIISIK